MSGVYGSFYEHFPELQELFQVYTKPDKSDIRDVVAIYMPNKGGGLQRRKYTSGNTTQDIVDNDEFYISTVFGDMVHEGDYVQRPGNPLVYRLTHVVPYDKAAGYRVYVIERVTGTTPEKDQPLDVKEGKFA